MKVLHIITDLHTGGAETMLYRLMMQQSKFESINIVVSVTDKGTYGQKLEEKNIPLYTLNLKTWLSLPRALLRLLRIIKKQKPDMLMTWLYHADMLGLLAGRLNRIPVIWNLRCAEIMKGDHPSGLLKLRSLLARLSSMASIIIANSETGKEAHKAHGYRAKRWHVIPNGFDTDMYQPSEKYRLQIRQQLGLKPDALLAGVIARVHPMKDHATFLQAAEIVLASIPDAHFLLVGRGADHANKSLHEMIQSRGLMKSVHLLGEKNPAMPYVAALDVLVSSSYSEGFPNVVAEAMACAVPCVVTDAGDSAYIVGDTGLVVPCKDAEKLAEAMCSMLEMDPRRRAELGNLGRARVKENYSIDVIARKYKSLYESALQ